MRPFKLSAIRRVCVHVWTELWESAPPCRLHVWVCRSACVCVGECVHVCDIAWGVPRPPWVRMPVKGLTVVSVQEAADGWSLNDLRSPQIYNLAFEGCVFRADKRIWNFCQIRTVACSQRGHFSFKNISTSLSLKRCLNFNSVIFFSQWIQHYTTHK